MMNPRHNHWMVTAAVLSSVMVRTMILVGTVQMMFHNSDSNICVNAFTQIASPQSQQLRLNTFPPIYPSASLLHDPTQIASRWTLSSSSSMHHNSHHHQHQQPKGHSLLVRTIQNVVTTVSTVSLRKITALQQALLSIRSVLLRLQLLPLQRIRHSILVFVTSFLLIWNIGSLGLSSSLSSPFPFLTTPVAHAASSTSTITASSNTALTERMLDRISNSDVDKIIHQYVQKHMFDDDLSASDPIVGTYREAHYDHTLPQKYPMMLRNIITETFRGTKLMDTSSSSLLSASNVAKPPPLDVGLLLTRTVQLLQKTLGLTELTATIVLAITFVVAGPSVFLLFGMIVGGISKRNMDQIFKKRYGETYTVDATIKQEPVIELPSEDDDDDDDDDDSDDNGDDEDDDNETKGSNKNKKK